MVTVAVIGCGGMGSMHLNCYMAMQDLVNVVAIAEGNADKARPYADALGAKVYPNMEELIEAETPDILDICLPTHLHAKYAIMAMEKGCHVMLEKPVCLSKEEAEALLEAKAKCNKKVQVGHVLRFEKAYTFLRDVVSDGRYGKVKSASFRRLSAYPAWSAALTDYTKSGSVALDMHVHDVDFVRYVWGEPDELVSSAAVRDKEGVIQHLVSVYRYGDALITTEGGWDYPAKLPFTAEYWVNLERACIVLRDGAVTVYENGYTLVPDVRNDYEATAYCGINISNVGGFYAEIKYFVESVKNHTAEERSSLEDAIASFYLVQKEIELAGGVKI